ncbi:MAG: hypothetical protein JWO62_2646, partial [Acidimicrobiaceae bacterium]|nr:hypothetical protein [Acidimicrobiaceae bacterium]
MAVEAFPAFLQGETYSAAITRRSENFMLQRGATVGSVVGGVNGATDLQVSAQGPAAMAVNIAVGEANIPGTSASTQSGYYFYNNATLGVAVATASGANPRIDLAAATVSDTAYGGSDGGSCSVVTGTPAGSPVAPSLPGTSLGLADVLVPQSATSIIASDITDIRPFVYFGAAGIYNGRPVSGAGTINLASGDSAVTSSGNTPFVLPAPFKNARVRAYNYGSGIPTVTQHASEVIKGLGCGSSGVTSISIGTYGAFVELTSTDGVSWYITAGNSDSGWINPANGSYSNSWVNGSGSAIPFGWRVQGNKVLL